MVKIYFGCAIANAPKEFLNQALELRGRLRKKYEILEFLGTEMGSCADVYLHDIHTCVANCDLLLGVCDLPSLGLGYELATAIEKLNKPALVVAHNDARVSRLIEGIQHPKFTFQRYASLDEIEGFLEEKVKREFGN